MSRSVGVPAVLLAAFTFVGGLVVGGVGPRGEVRELQERVFQLERARARGGPVSGEELARFVTGGALDPSRPTCDDGGARAPVAPGPDAVARLGGPEDEPGASGHEARERGAGGPARGGVELDPIEAARETLEIRAAQARAALVEDIAPVPEQLEAIDRVVREMNDELAELAREFVDRMQGTDEPSRRDMMSMGSELLDVLVATEQRMLDVMTPEQRERVRDEATDPTSFVAPDVVETLMQLERLPR